MRVLTILAALLFTHTFTTYAGEGDVTFKKTKLVLIDDDGDTKEIKVNVIFKDDRLHIRVKNRKYIAQNQTIPYSVMENLIYERSKHRRLVLVSKRKHHWFSFDYQIPSYSKRTVLLRLDKSEERLFRKIVPQRTGKELEVLLED